MAADRVEIMSTSCCVYYCVALGNDVEGAAVAPPPPRTVSAASMASSLCPEQSSSSSSLSRDVSNINSSFTSHEALEVCGSHDLVKKSCDGGHA